MADEKKEMKDAEKKTQAMKDEFVRQKGLDRWDNIYTPGFNEWAKGQDGVAFLNSLGEATDSEGNKISEELQKKNAKNKSNATMRANTLYDTATTQPDNGSDVQTTNTQKAANEAQKRGEQLSHSGKNTPESILQKLKEGKATDDDLLAALGYIEDGTKVGGVNFFDRLGVKSRQAIKDYAEKNSIPSEKAAALLGSKITEEKEELSDEQINEKIEEAEEEVKSEEEVKKDITSQPAIDSQVAGLTGEPVKDLTQEKAIKTFETNFLPEETEKAINTYKEAPKEEKSRVWDKIAIFATAVSAILMIASKGEVPFFPFTRIGGTEDRIGKLNTLNAQIKEYNLNFKKFHNARYNYEKDKENGIIPNDMSFEDYKKEVASSQYGVSEKRAQDDANFDTWASQTKVTQENAMQVAQQAFEMKLKEMDKKHLQELEAAGQKAKLEVQKLIQEGNIRQAEQRLIQDLANRSKSEQYKYLLAVTGDTASSLRSIGLPSTGDSVLKYANGIVDNVTKVANTAVNFMSGGGNLPAPPVQRQGTDSDSNCKKVKHTYIPASQRGDGIKNKRSK